MMRVLAIGQSVPKSRWPKQWVDSRAYAPDGEAVEVLACGHAHYPSFIFSEAGAALKRRCELCAKAARQ